MRFNAGMVYLNDPVNSWMSLSLNPGEQRKKPNFHLSVYTAFILFYIETSDDTDKFSKTCVR